MSCAFLFTLSVFAVSVVLLEAKGGNALRHLQHNVAATFGVAQFGIADGSDAAAVNAVAYFYFLIAAIAQTDQRAAAGGFAVDADQVHFAQVDRVFDGGAAGNGGFGGQAGCDSAGCYCGCCYNACLFLWRGALGALHDA